MHQLLHHLPVCGACQAIFLEGPRVYTAGVISTLKPAQRASYARDGFLVLPGLFTPAEAARLSTWTEEITAWPEVAGRHMVYWEAHRTQPGRRVRNRIENFYPYHDGFRAVFDGGPLAEVSAALLGEPAALFKDKINFKMPGGDGFEPHQDQQAGWSVYAPHFVTALVSIDAATLENGCLELAAGHHRRGLVGAEWRPLGAAEMAGMEFVACPTRPGDAVFFDSYVPHRSAANGTDAPRRVLYVTYNRASDGDHRLRYFADKRRSYPPDCEREPGREYVYRV
jgi:2-aminoethylphosphonate dioxygenase